MKALINRFVREEEGQDIIEYALLAAFVSVVAILVIQNIGTLVTTNYQSVETALSPAP